MRKILNKHILIIGAFIIALAACKRDSDYMIVTPSPFISNFDLKKLYKGTDVTLTRAVTGEATSVQGQVTSDHSGHNLPEGLLFIQNLRMVGSGIDSLRGIAINIGAAAANYVPGDSVKINIEGGVLKRVNGILQITGVSASNIVKIASGVTLLTTSISAVTMLAKPDNFEGCYGVVNNCNFEPNIGVETIEGVKGLNDGSGDMQMHVNGTADFKSELLPWSANVIGLVIPTAAGVPQIWPRIKADFFPTSIVVDPSIPLGPHPAIITGYLADPTGSDGNYEYIQFMATQDLDFRQKNFSVYTTNNAGASTPTGFPVNGWNTGDLRTYKFNLTRGTVAKGKFFYVGGYKKIYGSTSNDINQANWIVSKLYATVGGDDGIGSKTSNLLANSSNTAGIAIFPFTKNVLLESVPSDVVFFSSSIGSVYGSGVGYSICDNDFYKVMDGNAKQPFYRQGKNTDRLPQQESGYFSYLSGVYDATAKKWTTKRTHNTVQISTTSTLSLLEESSSDPMKLPLTKVVN
ncbi:hypothetical protein D3C87_376180 [compost metagenome]